MKIRKFIIFSLFFAWFPTAAAVSQAQEVAASARAFPEKITVGDEIRLVIQIERPKKFFVEAPSDKIDLSPFEIKKVEISPVIRGKNRVRETFILTLTVFKLGELKIPPVPIEVKSESGRVEKILTDPVPVKVASVGKKATDKDDIRPIKGPVSFKFFWLRAVLCGVAAACLAVFLAVKIILRRRKKIVDLESLKPPHERSFLELERLKKKGLLEEKKEKEFYSELSDILRRYLERRFEMDALERTTHEILSDLKEKDFDKSLIEKAREVLENSDLVKFAKFAPPRSMAEIIEARIVDIVKQTMPEEKEEGEKK